MCLLNKHNNLLNMFGKFNLALEFHHIDSTQKDKDYSNYKTSFDKLKPELDKCILLCSNCHREHHENN